MHDLEKYYVYSGSYYVGAQKPIVLQAVLGTCVGVALVGLERLEPAGYTKLHEGQAINMPTPEKIRNAVKKLGKKACPFISAQKYGSRTKPERSYSGLAG